MKASMWLVVFTSLFGSSVRSPRNRVASARGKSTPELVNKRTAAKSQRVQRIERGMRPRHAVHARKIERRAKHAIKGTPL